MISNFRNFQPQLSKNCPKRGNADSRRSKLKGQSNNEISNRFSHIPTQVEQEHDS